MTLASILLALVPLAVHPGSMSSSRVVVDGSRVELRIRCQLLSLIEVIEGLDTDRDGQVSAEELLEHEDAIVPYVADHYRLFSGSDRDFEGGTRLVMESFEASWLAPESFTEFGDSGGGADIRVEFLADAPIESLHVEVTLFHDTSPGHIDLASLFWRDEGPQTFALDVATPRFRSDPSGRGTFSAFVKLGFDHILSGLDHLAFLLVLLLGARSFKSLLGIVTAFTVAHSVSLALAATGVIDIGPYSGMVEVLIALSIAYLAMDNLMGEPSTRARWIESFVFGLIHGLGFAGFLGHSLIGEPSKLFALFSFNVGVELGQLLVVLLCVPVLCGWIVGRFRVPSGDPLIATPVRKSLSALTAVLALFWFVERIQ